MKKFMKKVVVLVCVLSMLLLVGCAKEEEGTEAKKDSASVEQSVEEGSEKDGAEGSEEADAPSSEETAESNTTEEINLDEMEAYTVYYVNVTSIGGDLDTIVSLYSEYVEGTDFAELKEVLENVPCVALETENADLAQAIKDVFTYNDSVAEVTTGTAYRKKPQSYYVKLLDIGPSKVMVIDAYMDVTGVDLATAKELVEMAPCCVYITQDLALAEKMVTALETAGAEVDDYIRYKEFVDYEEMATKVSDYWEDMEVMIDGVKYTWPYSTDLLAENGFTINEERVKEKSTYQETVAAGEKTFISIFCDHEVYDAGVSEEYKDSITGGGRATVEVMLGNFTNEEKGLFECDAHTLRVENSIGLSATAEPTIPFELAKGITLGSTYEEIVKAYGEPYFSSDAGDGIYVYYQVYTGTNTIELQLSISYELGLLDFQYSK